MFYVEDDILERLRIIATPTLANALDDIGFNGIMNDLHPAGIGMCVVGRAVTVQEITGPFGTFSSEDFKVGHMIDEANPRDVIVVANNGAKVSTWGGMASYSAKLKGVGRLLKKVPKPFKSKPGISSSSIVPSAISFKKLSISCLVCGPWTLSSCAKEDL